MEGWSYKITGLDIRKVSLHLLKSVSCIFSEHSAQVVILVLDAATDAQTGYPSAEVIEEITNTGRALALLAL